MKAIFLLALMLTYLNLSSQCFDDRHSSTRSASWISCETSINPNSERNTGHWIQYDLGEVRGLHQMHIWNLTHPEHLDDGARVVAIDLSDDGTSWREWGIIDIPRGEDTGFYEGITGPNFEGANARYVLLTVISTHGGTCAGLGEIMIDLGEPSSTSVIVIEDSKLTVSPNPAVSHADVSFNMDHQGEATLSVISITGQVIHREMINLTSGGKTIRLNLEDFSEGQYYVTLKAGAEEFSTELTKVKIK